MTKTAIMIDGGFYRRVSKQLWGDRTPAERAEELYEYATDHIKNNRDAKIEYGRRELYRIFYYDCPQIERATLLHPLTGKNVHFKKTDPSYKWAAAFHKELAQKRKVAMRMGEIVTENAAYNLKPEVTKRLLQKKITIDDLDPDRDFKPWFKQGGVDMRIGLDIASLAYQGIVDQIILITGDSDFVPAAKTARRHGIDFIVDPMGKHIRDDLIVHADGIETMVGSEASKKARSSRAKEKKS